MASLEELSKKSYLLEDWYQEQTRQWDELSSKGWEFTRPSYNPFMVGIRMSRGATVAEFGVSKVLSDEAVHSRLLKFCLAFDKAAE